MVYTEAVTSPREKALFSKERKAVNSYTFVPAAEIVKIGIYVLGLSAYNILNDIEASLGHGDVRSEEDSQGLIEGRNGMGNGLTRKETKIR